MRNKVFVGLTSFLLGVSLLPSTYAQAKSSIPSPTKDQWEMTIWATGKYQADLDIEYNNGSTSETISGDLSNSSDGSRTWYIWGNPQSISALVQDQDSSGVVSIMIDKRTSPYQSKNATSKAQYGIASVSIANFH